MPRRWLAQDRKWKASAHSSVQFLQRFIQLPIVNNFIKNLLRLWMSHPNGKVASSTYMYCLNKEIIMQACPFQFYSRIKSLVPLLWLIKLINLTQSCYCFKDRPGSVGPVVCCAVPSPGSCCLPRRFWRKKLKGNKGSSLGWLEATLTAAGPWVGNCNLGLGV